VHTWHEQLQDLDAGPPAGRPLPQHERTPAWAAAFNAQRKASQISLRRRNHGVNGAL
jgi:hypothetical protein